VTPVLGHAIGISGDTEHNVSGATCTTLAGAVGCSIEAIPARDLMTEVRRHNEVAIHERLQLAHKAEELPKWLNVDDYTRYISMPVEVQAQGP
jgi:hypothetical protein